jgi:hypothetical protein
MRKALVVLALGVALLVPAAAFAGDDSGSDQDHAGIAVTEAIQTEPIQLGAVSGADHAPFGPYFEMRQENYDN